MKLGSPYILYLILIMFNKLNKTCTLMLALIYNVSIAGLLSILQLTNISAYGVWIGLNDLQSEKQFRYDILDLG